MRSPVFASLPPVVPARGANKLDSQKGATGLSLVHDLQILLDFHNFSILHECGVSLSLRRRSKRSLGCEVRVCRAVSHRTLALVHQGLLPSEWQLTPTQPDQTRDPISSCAKIEKLQMPFVLQTRRAIPPGFVAV